MKDESNLPEEVSSFVIDRVGALITVYNIKKGSYLFVNSGLTKLLGYQPDAFLKGGIGFASSIIHPEDLERINNQNRRALRLANSSIGGKGSNRQIVNFEYRMKHKNGQWIWLHTDGSVFSRDEQGKVENVMNISVDITDRKNREIKTHQELIESEVRYKTFLAQSTEGIWRFELEKPVSIRLSMQKQIDHFYKYAYLAECNDAMAKMYGFKRAKEILGIKLVVLMPKKDQSNIEYLTAFVNSNYKLTGAVSHERDKEGKLRIIQNNLIGVVENGEIKRAWGTQTDITKQKLLQERLEFLESVSKKLMVSLDQKIALQELTKLIIPYFADYCRIAVIDEEGKISEIAANHLDPNKITLVNDLYESYRDQADSNYGIGSLLSRGKPELISHIDGGVLQPIKSNSKLMKIIKKIGLKSYMGFPLIARGKVIGAITFSSIKADRFYTGEDQAFAQLLVSRISLVLDNFRLYEQARKAISLRDDFISVASHELRTPLTSLKIYSQLMNKSKKAINIVERTFASRINIQVDKLIQLIGDLLDISKIQAGKLEFRLENFDLKKSVNEVVESFRHQEIRQQLIVDGSLKSEVFADKNRIEQVLINLLTNAIKYSPEAKKILILLEEQGDRVTVKVVDYGIGIDKEDQVKIFQRFYRVQSDKKNSFPGLGIGLYISKEIINRHGGEIKVFSKKGKGSTFSFSIPLKYKGLNKP